MSESTVKLVKGQRQKGFSLVEMMISMTVGLIAMAGVISLFANSVKSNTDGLQQTRLSQELRAIMDVMVRDIRRSGYWSDAEDNAIGTNNPFQDLSINAAENCITYLYQKDTAKTEGDTENQFGFRLDADEGIVQIRSNGTTCDSSSYWQAISTPGVVNVTGLQFDLTSDCKNIGTSGNDCDTAQSGEILYTTNYINITLAGQLVNDNTVALTLNEQVTVKNPIATVAP